MDAHAAAAADTRAADEAAAAARALPDAAGANSPATHVGGLALGAQAATPAAQGGQGHSPARTRPMCRARRVGDKPPMRVRRPLLVLLPLRTKPSGMPSFASHPCSLAADAASSRTCDSARADTLPLGLDDAPSSPSDTDGADLLRASLWASGWAQELASSKPCLFATPPRAHPAPDEDKDKDTRCAALSVACTPVFRVLPGGGVRALPSAAMGERSAKRRMLAFE